MYRFVDLTDYYYTGDILDEERKKYAVCAILDTITDSFFNNGYSHVLSDMEEVKDLKNCDIDRAISLIPKDFWR